MEVEMKGSSKTENRPNSLKCMKIMLMLYMKSPWAGPSYSMKGKSMFFSPVPT